jgi:hypothetical protein
MSEIFHQVTLKVFDANGFDEYYTVRASTVNELMQNVKLFKAWLLEQGYTPQQANGNGHANGNGANGGAAGGSGPMCPDGHGPMKQSTKKPGSWYCPASVGTHPQTGKNLYCTHKIE